VLRRDTAGTSAVLIAGELRLDTARHQVTLDGNGLALTAVTARVVLDERQSSPVARREADAHTGVIEQQRYARLRARLADGDQSFVLEHLAQHPEDTGTILQMLTVGRERNDQNRLALLDRLLNQGFVQEADVGGLRDAILGSPGVLPAAHPAPGVITPVARVKYGSGESAGEFTIADGGPGEITMALRDTLTGIQRGTFADTHGWMARLS